MDLILQLQEAAFEKFGERMSADMALNALEISRHLSDANGWPTAEGALSMLHLRHTRSADTDQFSAQMVKLPQQVLNDDTHNTTAGNATGYFSSKSSHRSISPASSLASHQRSPVKSPAQGQATHGIQDQDSHAPPPPPPDTRTASKGLIIRVTKGRQRTEAKPTRKSEKQITELTGDHEVLTSRNRKLKKEVASEDEEGEIQAEFDPAIKSHNFFNPEQQRAVKTAQGYVKSTFVVKDHDSDAEPSTTEEKEEDDDDDDDTSWAPDSDVDTPSPTRQPSFKAVNKQQFKEFMKWKSGGAAAQPSTSLPPQSHHTSSQHYELPVKEPSIDAHQRSSLNLPVVLEEKAPAHGDWNDISHLMTVYLPLYEKYKAKCGTKFFCETIWEGYTPPQRRRISRYLSKTVNGVKQDYNEERLASISNEEFIRLMCSEKGYSTAALTKIALRKITFKGTLTDRDSWINNEAAWEECLQQASMSGEIERKRLVTIQEKAYLTLSSRQQCYKSASTLGKLSTATWLTYSSRTHSSCVRGMRMYSNVNTITNTTTQLLATNPTVKSTNPKGNQRNPTKQAKSSTHWNIAQANTRMSIQISSWI